MGGRLLGDDDSVKPPRNCCQWFQQHLRPTTQEMEKPKEASDSQSEAVQTERREDESSGGGETSQNVAKLGFSFNMYRRFGSGRIVAR